ncbi:DUF4236 domain-containing protein [Streptoverticillium reticulum]|uniref:DUF4236 domain-containing protein n=1 Tax=Streptoverticillium reticulum TaxID=1433415 RepID=UPI0039BF669B
MPLLFRKSFTLVPGLLRLNVNRKSVSVSVGPRGLARTYSSTGRRTTSVDLPGPFSWRTTSHRRRRR